MSISVSPSLSLSLFSSLSLSRSFSLHMTREQSNYIYVCIRELQGVADYDLHLSRSELQCVAREQSN